MLAKRGRFGLGSNQRLLALSFFKFVPRSGLSAVFFSISVVVKKGLYKVLLDMPVYFS